LYDKLPLHAFCWKPIEGDPLPLDYLQLWDSLSYDITVLKKAQLQSMRCKFKLKSGSWMFGEYMFTVDSAHPDFNVLDTGFSEDIEDHKSYNFVRCDNGQFAAQPNNRVLFYDQSLTPKGVTIPDFKVSTKEFHCEDGLKWSSGESDDFFYILEKK
jgi:hypothetical protein